MANKREPIPRSIGSYSILNEIGRGATGTVHLARNVNTQQIVCVKIMEKELMNSEENLHFFKREVSILSGLDHPNIVKYYDLLEDSTYYFLFMEYCQGESLQKAIDRPGNLSENYIITVFRQLLSALQYLHETGIGHRDLKPENIIIGPSNAVKLVDFGLSTDNNTQLRTTFCGSLAFAAPECIEREPYLAAKADIWSAGVILYMMATNNLPWNTSNLVHMMKRITQGKYTIPSNVPLGCQDLIKKMLRHNPAERPLASQLLADMWLKKPVAKPSPPKRTNQRHRSFTGVSPRQQISRVNSDPSFCVTPPRAETPRRTQNPRKFRERSQSVDRFCLRGQVPFFTESGNDCSILVTNPSM